MKIFFYFKFIHQANEQSIEKGLKKKHRNHFGIKRMYYSMENISTLNMYYEEFMRVFHFTNNLVVLKKAHWHDTMNNCS